LHGTANALSPSRGFPNGRSIIASDQTYKLFSKSSGGKITFFIVSISNYFTGFYTGISTFLKKRESGSSACSNSGANQQRRFPFQKPRLQSLRASSLL
jgi:hypothetical protein